MYMNNFKRMGYALVLLFSFFSASHSAEVRHIVPPKLTKGHLGQNILCHRPMRHGSPQMSIEQKGDQVIAHNYGHGGSGWTLAPGSAAYVNNLLLHHSAAHDLTKNTPITIVGAGVVGLFSAYDLVQRGFRNIIVIAEKFHGLPSNNAGGLLAPVSMDNDSEMQHIVNQIGIDAYKFYASVAKNELKDFPGGAVIVPTYFESRVESGLEPYVGTVMKPAKDVILDFGNGTRRPMVAYDDGIYMDTGRMLVDLRSYLKRKKVKFIQKKIHSFSDLQGKYIINCAGLGSGALNKDSQMESVQGHLIMLKDQNPEKLKYMILVYFGEEQTKSGQKVKRSFYFFPKHLPQTAPKDVGVIGGTFVEKATRETPNLEEFDIMLQGAKNFYGIK